MTRIMDSMLNEDEPQQEVDIIELMYIFSIVWSLGACLKVEGRKRFEDFLRGISGRALPATSLYDNYFDYEKSKNFITWEKLVQGYQPPIDGKFSKILVPTVDTQRFSFILGQHINSKKPCLFVGESGTAKSVIISNYLNNSLSSDSYMRLNINFSSRTTSSDLQRNIEDNIDKRTGRIFGPKNPGK